MRTAIQVFAIVSTSGLSTDTKPVTVKNERLMTNDQALVLVLPALIQTALPVCFTAAEISL